jgi:hypothetical protein
MATKRITASEKKTTAPKRARTTQTTQVVPSTDIACRAYELFMERGGAHGHDVEDWLAAERELSGHAL